MMMFLCFWISNSCRLMMISFALFAKCYSYACTECYFFFHQSTTWKITSFLKPMNLELSTGHGRSVSVACAVLVALGLADDWKSAEKIIREKRPFIKMNDLHRKKLEEWSKHRLSPTKRDGVSAVSSAILSDKS